MGLLSKIRENREERDRRFLEQIERNTQAARDSLIGEMVRGDLIQLYKRYDAIGRFCKRGDYDTAAHVARETHGLLRRKPDPALECEHSGYAIDSETAIGFCDEILRAHETVYNRLISICPNYPRTPIDSLLSLAESGHLEELSDFVSRLSDSYGRI